MHILYLVLGGGQQGVEKIEEYKLLDFGAGSGLLVRILRDIGIDAYFYDEYCKNIFARGFEWEKDKKPKLITSFEVFEHLENPKETIFNMLDISPNILFSTELLPNPTPKKWWYYGFNHGQHISFYTKESLYFLAKERQLNLYSINNIHLISEEKINLILLKMIIKFANRGLFSYVKTKLKSKTMQDHEMLLESKN